MPSTIPSAHHPTPIFPRYIGRFAPSPTGALHFGSLVSALASYLDAKANSGQWLVRMEDLDPPREEAGAANLILRSLEEHKLEWDGEVMHQSQRRNRYEERLHELRDKHLIYACNCSRQRLQSLGGIYDGHCRANPPASTDPIAWRLKLYNAPNLPTGEVVLFDDLIQGAQLQNLRTQAGDQILKRRDGFYAYQLAVVVDDIDQQISHIIRGSDLLEVTARQIFLFQCLGAPVPQFGHVPLAIQANGQKLSKQNHARPLESERANINLWRALVFLGQNPSPDLQQASPAEILTWAMAHWQLPLVQGLSRYHDDE